MLNNASITVSTCRWGTRNCLYKTEKPKWQAPTLLCLVLIFTSDLIIFEKKNEAFSYYSSIFTVSISSSLPHAYHANQQWVKLEMRRLKVDFLCQEKLVDDLLSSLRRNLNNMQMHTEDRLLLWDHKWKPHIILYAIATSAYHCKSKSK